MSGTPIAEVPENAADLTSNLQSAQANFRRFGGSRAFVVMLALAAGIEQRNRRGHLALGDIAPGGSSRCG